MSGSETESGVARPPSFRWRSAAVWIAFTLLFLLALYVRCAGLTERGIAMEEPDTWKYLRVAQDWTEGHHSWMGGGRFYRPAIHLLHAWAWRTFGVNHYAIKIVNVSLDSGVLLLLFFLTRALAGNAWAGIAAIAIYAFVPNVIRNIWIEQHFTPATFLILVAVCLARLGLRATRFDPLRLLSLALSGLALGTAVNMHPDLMLLAPGLILAIAWITVARAPGNPTDRLIANMAVFGGGLTGVYVLGVAFLGAKEVVAVASREFFEHTERYAGMGESLGYFGRLSRIAVESVSGLLLHHMLFLYAFLGAVALVALTPLARRFRGLPRDEHNDGELGLVLLPVLAYGFLFALTIGWFKSWLLFYPLFPLAIITFVCGFHRLFTACSSKWAPAATVCAAVLFACYNPHLTPGTLRTGYFAPDRLLPAYEFLRGKADENNRVVVMPTGDPLAPFPAYQSVAGLASPVYLGKLATYLPGLSDFSFPYTAESLRQFCLKHHVRYIVDLNPGAWTREWTDETLKQFPQFQIIDSWQPYSYAAEQDILNQFLTSVGAMRIAETENGIYELPAVTDPALNTKIEAPVPPFSPEVLNTTKLWDFRTLTPETYSWIFPGGCRIQTPQGAISTIAIGNNAYIDLRGVRLDAASLNGVWIEAMLDDKATNALEQIPLPKDTEALFLWAREGDYTPGEWPYVLVRRTALGRVNPNEPLLFVTTLKDRSPLFSGTITDIAIRFTIRSAPGGARDAHLIVRRIGFF